jgi:hypothetical protein
MGCFRLNATLDVLVGSVAALSVQAPAQALAGLPFVPQPVVEILDSGGNVANVSLVLRAHLSPANAMAGFFTSDVTSVQGVATFTDMRISANGSYTVGTSITPQVVFSETVTVSGTPVLALNVGERTANATYSSGSPSTTLTFSYPIQAGDTSSDLAYTSTSALSTNGGTIRDAAGNDAVLTLASPGAAGSLDAAKNVVVDTTAPTVVGVSSSTADGIYPVGSAVSIQVEFSEVVTVTGTPQLTMGAGAGANATYVSGSGTTVLTLSYTVLAGHTSSDLDYSSTAGVRCLK